MKVTMSEYQTEGAYFDKGKYWKAKKAASAKKYPKPEGWKKPTAYPGLKGAEFKKWLGKGVLNMGLLDPHGTKADKKLKAAVWKNIIKMLIESKGAMVYVSDLEWTLKLIYPSGYIKGQLKDDLEESLQLMLDKTIYVSIYKVDKVPGIGGWGWSIESKWLKKVIN
jgi:hypothetical protein